MGRLDGDSRSAALESPSPCVGVAGVRGDGDGTNCGAASVFARVLASPEKSEARCAAGLGGFAGGLAAQPSKQATNAH